MTEEIKNNDAVEAAFKTEDEVNTEEMQAFDNLSEEEKETLEKEYQEYINNWMCKNSKELLYEADQISLIRDELIAKEEELNKDLPETDEDGNPVERKQLENFDAFLNFRLGFHMHNLYKNLQQGDLWWVNAVRERPEWFDLRLEVKPEELTYKTRDEILDAYKEIYANSIEVEESIEE